MLTVKMWKDINTFEPIKNGDLDVDGTVKRIADFRGKTVEEVEEMEISDLLPEFLKCYHEANAAVFTKLNTLPKNAEGDGN